MKNIIKRKHYTSPFPQIREAVNVLVNFIKPTFGPASNKILIGDEIKSYAIDDGVKIADEFGVENDLQNVVMNFVKAAAKKTNERVGDGTTGCMIILQAILNEVADFNQQETVKEIKKALIEAKEYLLSKAQKISTIEELTAVAEVSCNDPQLAKVIGEVVSKVGLDGAIAVEEGNEFETKYNITEGMQFDRGFVSPHMATNQDRQEAILEDPYVLLFDKKIGINDVWPFFEKLMKVEVGKRNVLIVAEEIDPSVINTIVVNKIKGLFKIVAVNSPGYASNRIEYLKDLAAVTKATIFDSTKKADEITIESLGMAEKAIITKNSCTIIKGEGDPTERIGQIKSELGGNKFDDDRRAERIAKMMGGVAMIKVGGMTDEEVKAVYEKVEDAVNATKSALRDGVVRGAGVELIEVKTSSELLNKALRAPSMTLMENMGWKEGEAIPEVKDPVGVLIAQVESAVSIACLLLSTKGIFTKCYDFKENEDEE